MRSGFSRRFVGAVTACLIACAVFPSVGWSLIPSQPIIADAEKSKAETPGALPFRHEEGGFGKNLVIVTGFLTMLGLGAYGLIRYGRSRLGPIGANKDAPLIRVLEFRRVAPKLSVYRLRLGSGREATIADNGAALLLLESNDPRTDGPMETRPDA